jgi:hypothetical protein
MGAAHPHMAGMWLPVGLHTEVDQQRLTNIDFSSRNIIAFFLVADLLDTSSEQKQLSIS